MSASIINQFFLNQKACLHQYIEIWIDIFRRLHKVSTPRYALKSYKIEPTISYNAGGIHIETELTDWTLIHGIQEANE